eukprot:456607-Pyramimonas_sp.AAC.1
MQFPTAGSSYGLIRACELLNTQNSLHIAKQGARCRPVHPAGARTKPCYYSYGCSSSIATRRDRHYCRCTL